MHWGIDIYISEADAQPEWWISSHDPQPLSKYFYHANAVDMCNASLPDATFNKLYVSWAAVTIL
jgi:hypothetical protein